MQNEIFYSLNTEDIQSVAIEEIGRELNDAEIERVQSFVSENIQWYEVIAQAITTEHIK